MKELEEISRLNKRLEEINETLKSFEDKGDIISVIKYLNVDLEKKIIEFTLEAIKSIKKHSTHA